MQWHPTRVFIASGLVLRASLRAYWVVLATWVAIDLQLSPMELILLGTAMELTLLVSEIPTGVVADVISRRLSVILSFLIMGTAMVGAGLTENVLVLVGTQMLWGLGWTFQSGAETAWVTDELGGHAQVERLILRRARYQFGFSILGMALGAGLAAVTTLPTAIVTAGVVMIAWGLVLVLVMGEHEFERQRGDTWGQFVRTLGAGATHTRRTPALRVMAVVVMLGALGGEVMDRLDIRRLDQVGLPGDIDEIVIVGLIATIEGIVGFGCVLRVERGVGSRRLPLAAATILGAAAIGAAMLGLVAVLPLAAAGLVIQGGMRSSLAPVYTAWTNAHAPAATRATVHSFVGQADAAGEVVGGLALGWLATAATVPTAMSVSAVLFGAGALVATRGRAVWRPGRADGSQLP